jgi:hypothetical protein
MSNKTKAYFMEVADFKAFIGVSKLDIYTDKEDPSKKSIKAGSVWINIQKDIDMKGRLVFITDDLLPLIVLKAHARWSLLKASNRYKHKGEIPCVFLFCFLFFCLNYILVLTLF